MRGSKAASSADRAGSGTGTSDVTAERAETVPGKADAKERTVARRAGMSSWAGGWASVGEGEVKKVGWERSVLGRWDVHQKKEQVRGSGGSGWV